VYQRILIPLDGSDLSECSLQHVKAIAQGCNVPDVVVFRVIVPLSAEARSALATVGDERLRSAVRQNEQDAKDYVLKVRDRLQTQGVSSRTVTVQGRAADEILSYAEKTNVDLIVMSSHGRSGLSRFFYGSVAEKVVRHSRVPVLLVSPEGCRTIPSTK
jgi:nucleotide-binding universal stress UspA family protein